VIAKARARSAWALALVAGLAFAGGARAEQPLPVYPGTIHTRIGNDLLIGGEYYRLAYFTTPDPMKKVAKYFHEHWKKDGYPVTVDGDFVDEGVVSAFYTREGLVRSVVVRKHEGKTVGFSVLKDVWLSSGGQATADKVPQLEGSIFQQDVVARDTDGQTQHRAQLIEASLEESRARAIASWKNAGYSLARESGVVVDGQKQRVIELIKGKAQVVVTLAEADAKMTAVQQVWVGSDRPDAVPNDIAVERSRREAEAAGLLGKKK
jgi:hypothetical protein